MLREAVALGVNHIDTADFYGPHTTNQIIRKALHPYPKGLVIVTKLGDRRPPTSRGIPALSPEELTVGVHDNLRNLGLEALDVVNYRGYGADPRHRGGVHRRAGDGAGSASSRKGLIRHIGLSNVTAAGG